jgi:hypothetical protein
MRLDVDDKRAVFSLIEAGGHLVDDLVEPFRLCPGDETPRFDPRYRKEVFDQTR